MSDKAKYEYAFVPASVGSDFVWTGNNTNINDEIDEYVAAGWQLDRVCNAGSDRNSDKGIMIVMKRELAKEEDDKTEVEEKPQEISLLQKVLDQEEYSIVSVCEVSDDGKRAGAYVRDLSTGALTMITVILTRKEHQATTARYTVLSWSHDRYGFHGPHFDTTLTRQFEPRFRSYACSTKEAQAFVELVNDAHDALTSLEHIIK